MTMSEMNNKIEGLLGDNPARGEGIANAQANYNELGKAAGDLVIKYKRMQKDYARFVSSAEKSKKTTQDEADIVAD